MKERLVQLLDLEQLSPSKFADIIGVQRSSVSHVISGRNNPGFDFLQKTLKAFPGLNADWLMLGEGTMYEKMGRSLPGNLFDQPAIQPEAVPSDDISPEGGSRKAESENSRDVDYETGNEKSGEEGAEGESYEDEVFKRSGHSKRIVQVLVFYEDNSFRSYGPAQ